MFMAENRLQLQKAVRKKRLNVFTIDKVLKLLKASNKCLSLKH